MPKAEAEAGAGSRVDAGCRVDVGRVWRVLLESVDDCADGFALTDPRNAAHYRRDAERFGGRPAPRDEDEIFDRYAEAADLRERWGERFVARVRRIPR